MVTSEFQVMYKMADFYSFFWFFWFFWGSDRRRGSHPHLHIAVCSLKEAGLQTARDKDRQGSKECGNARVFVGTWSRFALPSGNEPSGWAPTIHPWKRPAPTMPAFSTRTRSPSATSPIWRVHFRRCPLTSASTTPTTPRRSRRSSRRKHVWRRRRWRASRLPRPVPCRPLPPSCVWSLSRRGTALGMLLPWLFHWTTNGCTAIGLRATTTQSKPLCSMRWCAAATPAFRRVATSHRLPAGTWQTLNWNRRRFHQARNLQNVMIVRAASEGVRVSSRHPEHTSELGWTLTGYQSLRSFVCAFAY